MKVPTDCIKIRIKLMSVTLIQGFHHRGSNGNETGSHHYTDNSKMAAGK